MAVGYAAVARTTILAGETSAIGATSISQSTTSTESQSTWCDNSRKLTLPKQPILISWGQKWLSLIRKQRNRCPRKGKKTVSQEMRSESVTGCASIALTSTFLSVTTAIVANETASLRQAFLRVRTSWRNSRKQVVQRSTFWRSLPKCKTPVSTAKLQFSILASLGKTRRSDVCFHRCNLVLAICF